MKTENEINEINEQRKKCIHLLLEAKKIMADTECSLGASIISDAIYQITQEGADEY